MGHYAKVRDEVVVDIIVAEADFFTDFIDTTPGEWIQTSYNTRSGIHYNNEDNDDWTVPSEDQSKALRKNYAMVGGTYDRDRDAFIPPQLYSSWTLNEDTCQWDPPVDYPDGYESNPELFLWNEADLRWDNVE